MKNSTIILNEPGTFHHQEMDLDTDLKPDEALLKVHRVGICGTDLHAYSGNQPFFSYPRILGHELGVEVVAIGENVKNVSVGDRCAVEPYRYNPDDAAVKMGKPNCAERMSVLGVHEDGGMRDYIKFPASFLHLSDSLSYDQLALVEPLAIGCHAVQRAGVSADDQVLVIGAGPIGLGALQFALDGGASVAVMDLDDNRLTYCQENFTIEGTIQPKKQDSEKELRSLFDGKLPSVILDATGHKGSMENTFSLAAHGGRVVFIGLIQADISFNDPLFHSKELTLLASRNALAGDFKHIIQSMEDGRIDAGNWITHRSSLEEIPDQFDSWIDPTTGVIKAMAHVN